MRTRNAMQAGGWVGAFLLTILAATWALDAFGTVELGFGLVAPAAAFFAGLNFTLRDGIHEYAGPRWVWLAIGAGTLLSLAINPGFALASGAAFALSEAADYAVYAPLRKRAWLAAALLSNTAGAVIDSAVFLWLAFGALDFFAGQMVAKTLTTLVAVGLMWVWRNRGDLPVGVRAGRPA